jgi:hypothetical protein
MDVEQMRIPKEQIPDRCTPDRLRNLIHSNHIYAPSILHPTDEQKKNIYTNGNKCKIRKFTKYIYPLYLNVMISRRNHVTDQQYGKGKLDTSETILPEHIDFEDFVSILFNVNKKNYKHIY